MLLGVPMRAKRRPSDLAPWLCLAAAVIVIDAIQIARGAPTLSAAHQRAVKHPVARWPVLVVWAVLGCHLTWGKP